MSKKLAIFTDDTIRPRLPPEIYHGTPTKMHFVIARDIGLCAASFHAAARSR